MSGNLFDDSPVPPTLPADSPLAERLRPKTLDEVVGLEELLGEGRFLRNAIASDRIPSMILWGPPGSGKTTLARIIARTTRARFVPFSATSTSIKDIRILMDEARKTRAARGSRTIVFIDEIHRFNKAQQDAFLPYVEAGDIVLIGATTENPSFEVNSALLSRAAVYVLQPLSDAELGELLRRDRRLEARMPLLADRRRVALAGAPDLAHAVVLVEEEELEAPQRRQPARRLVAVRRDRGGLERLREGVRCVLELAMHLRGAALAAPHARELDREPDAGQREQEVGRRENVGGQAEKW